MQPSSNNNKPDDSHSEQAVERVVRSERKLTFFKPFAKVTPFICAFCGGRSCKHENYLTNPGSAIKGLNCDWVTPNILATQRPSSRIISEFNIIKQFKDKGINAILNLQEPGEHPSCGDGILPQSGFSYLPEEFYEHGIYFFNFGWRDMTATSPDIILKILKQMSFIITNGEKIAVHCHAGRGRTGMVIAAWLIYHDNMSAKEAIKLVKIKRKDSISKKSQEQVLYELERVIKSLRLIFFSSPKFGLEHYMSNQKKVFPLSSTSQEKYVPKIITIALERIESLVMSNVREPKHIVDSFFALDSAESFTQKWDAKYEKNLKTFKERVNRGNFKVSDVEDPRYLVQIMLDFLDHFINPAIGTRFMTAIDSKFQGDAKLSENVKNQLFHEVDKKEMFLVETFARLFSILVDLDRTIVPRLQLAITRLCISLLLGKSRHDKLFLKRNLIKVPNDDPKVLKLKSLIYKWIENFNEEFTNSFMMIPDEGSSALAIGERKMALIKRISSKTLLNQTIARLSSFGVSKAFSGVGVTASALKQSRKLSIESLDNMTYETEGEEFEDQTTNKNNLTVETLSPQKIRAPSSHRERTESFERPISIKVEPAKKNELIRVDSSKKLEPIKIEPIKKLDIPKIESTRKQEPTSAELARRLEPIYYDTTKKYDSSREPVRESIRSESAKKLEPLRDSSRGPVVRQDSVKKSEPIRSESAKKHEFVREHSREPAVGRDSTKKSSIKEPANSGLLKGLESLIQADREYSVKPEAVKKRGIDLRINSVESIKEDEVFPYRDSAPKRALSRGVGRREDTVSPYINSTPRGVMSRGVVRKEEETSPYFDNIGKRPPFKDAGKSPGIPAPRIKKTWEVTNLRQNSGKIKSLVLDADVPIRHFEPTTVKNVKIKNTIYTPRVNDIYSNIEKLDVDEQEALFEKLTFLKGKKHKALY